MLKRILLATCCSLFLSACSVYTLVESKKPVNVRGLTLQTAINWTEINSRHVNSDTANLWTIDGLSLNQLMIFGEVSEGDVLFTINNKELTMPTYKSDMLPNGVSELLVSSLKNSYGGTLTINASSLRPEKFGAKKGFSFSVDFFDSNGLFIKGKAFATTQNEQLYMVLYMAPNMHYYNEYIPHVEDLVASAEITGKSKE